IAHPASIPDAALRIFLPSTTLCCAYLPFSHPERTARLVGGLTGPVDKGNLPAGALPRGRATKLTLPRPDFLSRTNNCVGNSASFPLYKRCGEPPTASPATSGNWAERRTLLCQGRCPLSSGGPGTTPSGGKKEKTPPGDGAGPVSSHGLPE